MNLGSLQKTSAPGILESPGGRAGSHSPALPQLQNSGFVPQTAAGVTERLRSPDPGFDFRLGSPRESA